MNETTNTENGNAVGGRMQALVMHSGLTLDGKHRVAIRHKYDDVAVVELLDLPKVYGCNGLLHYQRRVCRVSRLAYSAPTVQLELSV